MRDVVLVTADSIRYDAVEDLSVLSTYDVKRAIAGAHYTRPSLASVHSASYEAAIRSRVVEPTLAQVLADVGYTCLGFAPSPQLDPAFDFDAGFSHYRNFVDAGNRGSRRREILGQFDIMRRIYHRIFPPHAKMSALPTDGEVVDHAIGQFNGTDGPRFLWVHLMESHRPYGRGDDAVPKALDRKSLFGADRLSDADHETLRTHYRRALGRVDDSIHRLLDGIEAADPIIAFTADHGDEFGEQGYYFHQPQRRRVARSLVEVPLAFDGLSVPAERASLLDVAPTLVDAVDGDIPDAWHGRSLFDFEREQTVTIAPWGDSASILWQDFETRIVAEDATVAIESGSARTTASEADVPTEIEDRLRDLGYVG